MSQAATQDRPVFSDASRSYAESLGTTPAQLLAPPLHIPDQGVKAYEAVALLAPRSTDDALQFAIDAMKNLSWTPERLQTFLAELGSSVALAKDVIDSAVVEHIDAAFVALDVPVVFDPLAAEKRNKLAVELAKLDGYGNALADDVPLECSDLDLSPLR